MLLSSKAPNHTSLIQKLLRDAMSTTLAQDADPRRFFFLRPSGFPYCGWRRVLDAREGVEMNELTEALSGYFFGVGHATHDVFQKHVGLTGKIVGDWKCRDCKHWQRATIYAVCPECGSEHMKYHELEVRYKGTLVGHVDGVIRLDPKKGAKSRHIVIDYKTSSLKKITMKKSPFPYYTNKSQIEKYVVLVESQYGFKMDGWALIYLARDQPVYRGVKVVYRSMGEKAKKDHLKELNKWVKLHRLFLRAYKESQFQKLLKHKLCSSKSNHDTMFPASYEACPHADKCFTALGQEKQMVRVLKYKDVFPVIDHAPDNILQELGLKEKLSEIKLRIKETKTTTKKKDKKE